MLRRAARSERGAFVRLFQSLKNEAADALGGFVDSPVGHSEAALRIEIKIRIAQAKPAFWDLADSSPFARHDSEHLAD